MKELPITKGDIIGFCGIRYVVMHTDSDYSPYLSCVQAGKPGSSRRHDIRRTSAMRLDIGRFEINDLTVKYKPEPGDE